MDSISVKGYKSFKDVTVPLRKINILIGSNGAGKSNFLSLFEFLGHVFEGTLEKAVTLSGGVDKLLHKGSKVTDRISIAIQEDKNMCALNLLASEGSLIIENENLEFEFSPANWRQVDIADVNSNSHSYNLAENLYEIQSKHPMVYKRIVKVIQSVAPFFHDFYFEPNKCDKVRLQWKDRFSDIIYDSNDLSGGIMRFIALAVLFMQPDLPKVIVVDEPELGLHPVAIEKLAGIIKMAANRGAQVIVAT